MDAPFLPPPAADNPLPAKKSGSSSFWVWVFLIIMFIALYSAFAAQPGDSWMGRFFGFAWTLFPYTWPVVVICGVIFYLWWQFRGSAQFQLSQEPGLLALAEGQLEKAAAVFKETMARYASQAQFGAVARHNLAVALRRQGKLAAAVEELIQVEKGAGLVYAAEVRLLAAIQLADCYALRGELEASRRWIEEARKRLARASHRTFTACQLRIAEATLKCREGQFEDALRGLERDWKQLEGNVSITLMRSAWLLRAYALSQLGGPRDASATPYLMMLRGQSMDHLAVEWPELKTFLATVA